MSGQNAHCASLRTGAWVPEAQLKLQVVALIFNLSIPTARYEAEARASPEFQEPASLMQAGVNSKETLPQTR